MAKEEEFLRTIHAFSGIAGRRVDFVMRKLAFDGLAGVLRRSPVDTGRFRGSWRLSLDVVDSSVEPQPKRGTKGPRRRGSPPGGSEIAGALTELKKVTRHKTIHISNSLPYSVRLEEGSSKQSPNGIVGPTFLSLRLGVIKAVADARRAVPDA